MYITPKMALTKDGNFHSRYFVEVGPPNVFPSYDDFQSYAAGFVLSGLKGYVAGFSGTGSMFVGGYTVKANYLGVYAVDSLQTYNTNSVFSGSNGESGWNGGYEDKNNYLGIMATDTLESYNTSSTFSGSNGGTGVWNGPYEDH